MPPANPDMNKDYDYAILYASFLLPDCVKKLKSLVRQVFPLRYSEERPAQKKNRAGPRSIVPMRQQDGFSPVSRFR